MMKEERHEALTNIKTENLLGLDKKRNMNFKIMIKMFEL